MMSTATHSPTAPPDCPPDLVAGTAVGVQGQRDQRLLELDGRLDGRGNPYFWVAFARGKSTIEAGTDLAALAEKRISVTPLRLDLTDEPSIRAALDGQCVALATLALVADLLQAGKLVAPLPQRFSNPRSYYLLLSAKAA